MDLFAAAAANASHKTLHRLVRHCRSSSARLFAGLLSGGLAFASCSSEPLRCEGVNDESSNSGGMHTDSASQLSALPAPPGRCAMGAAGACSGRGLLARASFQPGELIFHEDAVLSSNATAETLAFAFAEGSPGRAAAAEPIWGLVANYVAALEERSKRLGFLSLFYRPVALAADSATASRALYAAHAQQMLSAMRENARMLVESEALEDLLEVVRLNAHNVAVARAPAGSTSGSAARSPAVSMGLGLFFWLHLANHSCAPNAFFSTSPPTRMNPGHDRAAIVARAGISLRALCPIGDGEEICISYVDSKTLLQPLAWRRAVLQRHFGFVCRCARCTAEEAALAK